MATLGSHSDVPLVRARYSGFFIETAKDQGVSIDRILERASLSERALVNPDGFTSVWQLNQVAIASAILTDDLDIGWRAAETIPMQAYGAFSENVFSQETLYERLRAFCEFARHEYAGADFRVVPQNGNLCFERGHVVGDWIEARQIELYVLSMMVRTLQSILGESWQPRKITLQSFHRLDTERYFDLNITEIEFDQPQTRVIISDKDVSLSVDQSIEESRASSASAIPQGLSNTIEELIQSNLGDDRLSLKFIAKICDVHARTFQRLLSGHKTTFSSLVARQRVVVVSRLLHDTDMPIADISALVGYSHQTHLTRAFREYCGLTPAAYRRSRRA